MNKITPLGNNTSTQATPVRCGQIYSRVNNKGELEYFIVGKSDSGYYLFLLDSGKRWSSRSTDINEVFGVIAKRSEFTLVTEPIVLAPVND